MKNKKRIIIILALSLILSSLPLVALAVETKFIDVDPNAWYSKDVKIASDMGLIDGKTFNTFAPEDYLTYAEAVKLAACMNQKSITGSVTLKNGNPWYQTYVDYAKEKNIIKSDLNWDSYATRAGYMEIFANAISNLNPKNVVEDGKIPDVPMSHANSAAIYKLYRAGILQGVDDKHNCNPESNIKRSEVAAILTRMMNPNERLSFQIGEVIVEKPKELKILTQPVGKSIEKDKYGYFNIEATGEQPLSYQWQNRESSFSNWENMQDYKIVGRPDPIEGSNTKQLRIYNIGLVEKSSEIRCIVKDSKGNEVASIPVLLHLLKGSAESDKPLKITKNPVDASANVGSTMYFEVEAEGVELKYQWQFRSDSMSSFENLTDDQVLQGSNTNRISYRIPSFDLINELEFRCIVKDKNENMAISNIAKATINYEPPRILEQPEDIKGSVGMSAYLSVSAVGHELEYQWQISPFAYQPYQDIESPEARKPDYRINVGIMATKYRCVITDSRGAEIITREVFVTPNN